MIRHRSFRCYAASAFVALLTLGPATFAHADAGADGAGVDAAGAASGDVTTTVQEADPAFVCEQSCAGDCVSGCTLAAPRRPAGRDTRPLLLLGVMAGYVALRRRRPRRRGANAAYD